MKNIIHLASLILLSICCLITSQVDASALEKKRVMGKSEYLFTKEAAFIVQVDDNQHPKSCNYWLFLMHAKRASVPLYLEGRFENPSGGAPLIANAVLQPNTNHIPLISPPVRDLSPQRDYRIDIFVYGDAAKKNLISKHAQTIKSSLTVDCNAI